MNRVEHHNEPYHDDVGRRTFSQTGSARSITCAVLILLIRPSKCARITFLPRDISLEKQGIVESTLRTIWWSAQ